MSSNQNYNPFIVSTFTGPQQGTGPLMKCCYSTQPLTDTERKILVEIFQQIPIHYLDYNREEVFRIILEFCKCRNKQLVEINSRLDKIVEIANKKVE